MEGAARRWLVDISSWSPSPEEFSFLVSILPQIERRSVEKFVKLDDRKRALVSQLLQYALVHEVYNIPYNEISIERTVQGKPYLNTCGQVRYPAFNFSVSHSGNFVGIASEPMDLVGLDIISDTDFKKEPTLDLLYSLSSHFTYFEWNNISSAGNFNLVLREFCRYWSLKEAYVKALGIGLNFQLNRLEFHHTSWNDINVHVDGIKLKDWKFWLFDLDEKHWVTGHKSSLVSSFIPVDHIPCKVNVSGCSFQLYVGFWESHNQLMKITLQVSIARGVRENLQCEEYSSGFNLPNSAFIFRNIDELILIKDRRFYNTNHIHRD